VGRVFEAHRDLGEKMVRLADSARPYTLGSGVDEDGVFR
jgi:hypothetical protein